MIYDESRCPNCGNTTKGDIVYKCTHCYDIYCEACAGDGPLDTTCPHCGDLSAERLYDIK